MTSREGMPRPELQVPEQELVTRSGVATHEQNRSKDGVAFGEDHGLANDGAGMYVVVDGVGSSDTPYKAAVVLTNAIKSAIRRTNLGVKNIDSRRAEELLKEEVKQASAVIAAAAKSAGEKSQCVASIAKFMEPNRLLTVHAGDTRIYRYRPQNGTTEGLELLTTDDTFLSETASLSEQDTARLRKAYVALDRLAFQYGGDSSKVPSLALEEVANTYNLEIYLLTYYMNHRNVVKQVVGSRPSDGAEFAVHTGHYEVQDGDVELLCSDGLYENVSPDVIQGVLADPTLSPDQKANKLKELALQGKKIDDITIIVVETAPASSEEAKVEEALLSEEVGPPMLTVGDTVRAKGHVWEVIETFDPISVGLVKLERFDVSGARIIDTLALPDVSVYASSAETGVSLEDLITAASSLEELAEVLSLQGTIQTSRGTTQVTSIVDRIRYIARQADNVSTRGSDPDGIAPVKDKVRRQLSYITSSNGLRAKVQTLFEKQTSMTLAQESAQKGFANGDEVTINITADRFQGTWTVKGSEAQPDGKVLYRLQNTVGNKVKVNGTMLRRT